MSIKLAGITLRTPVLLAPMAGITDLPFRRVVAGFGAGLVVSEMVASEDLVRAKPSARAKAELGFGEAATAVQIAGREARWMAEAARIAEAAGAEVLDINMGCPAKRVTGGLAGSALMRDPDAALRLVEAVVGAVGVPVTLKMRLGWDASHPAAAGIAARAAAAGVALVTVHGRTRCQFYEGHADWAAIGATVRAAGVPVIANGDIAGHADARAALLASGAAGVMVGRAARGRPWLLAEIAAELAGEAPPAAPTGAALADLVLAHHDAMLGFYGRTLGLRVAKKHVGWYLATAGAPHAARRAALTADDPAAVARHVRAALADAGGALAA